MKLRVLFLFVCSMFVFTSCTQTTSKNDSNKQISELSEHKLAAEESFDVFLENFNRKPTFQRQRVLFPVKATLLDPSEYGMKMVKEDIEYEDWLLLDFTYDSSYATRQMDRYNQHIHLYADSARIEQRGIDNGIFANFLFTKKEGKWFLESFTDVSY